jgi:hypothetical protein
MAKANPTMTMAVAPPKVACTGLPGVLRVERTTADPPIRAQAPPHSSAKISSIIQ